MYRTIWPTNVRVRRSQRQESRAYTYIKVSPCSSYSFPLHCKLLPSLGIYHILTADRAYRHFLISHFRNVRAAFPTESALPKQSHCILNDRIMAMRASLRNTRRISIATRFKAYQVLVPDTRRPLGTTLLHACRFHFLCTETG